MTDDTTLAIVGGSLRGIGIAANQARQDRGFEPAADSNAAQDEAAADPPMRELLGMAKALGVVRMAAAEDCLASAGVLLQQGHSYAAFPVIRASSELSARAWWILDPRPEPRERVTRYLADFWNGLEEYRKIPAPGGRAALWSDARRSASLAEEAGFLVRERQGGVPALTPFEASPKPEHLLRQMLGEAPPEVRPAANYSYRLLSAFAHGEVAALQFVTGSPAEDDRITLGGRNEKVRPQLLIQSGLSVVFYLLAVRRHLRYFGWPGGIWESQLTETLQLMQSQPR